MIWLCKELEYPSDKGHGIKLNDAWDRYMTLAERAEIDIPRSFISADQHLRWPNTVFERAFADAI